jgi:capsid protein
MFALAFYREAVEPLGEVTGETEDGDGTPEKGYQVDFGRGPVLLDLEPGDRAEFLESKSPSTEFQAFTQTMIQTALKGLDIPYSFFDEAHTNYSGARQALLQYEQSADVKRHDVRLMLNNLTAWRLRLFLADGVLELPRGMTLADLRWEWIAKGIPWIDPLKEVNADIAAIGAGLASRTDVLKQQGKDFYDVADQLAAENEYLDSLGLPTNVAAANAQIVEITNG